MDATRHRLTHEAIDVGEEILKQLRETDELERAGNWYLAGETYRAIASSLVGSASPENRSRILVRAAASFEISGRERPAARAYFDAASELHNSRSRVDVAGELFNRAALLFHSIEEHFNAGDSWRRAGAAFLDAATDIITTPENIPPVPYSGGKYTVAGNCYVAAGDAFMQAGDNAMWACMAYWEGGRAHSRQHRGHHAFLAYKKALLAGIRFYGTHARTELRNYLPLSDEERTSKLDPLTLMEQEALLGNQASYEMNRMVYSAAWPHIQTHRDIAAAYHEFYLAFVAAGNLREASIYRAAEKERARRVFFLQREWGSGILYSLWSFFAGYGDSLVRWTVTCSAVVVGFGAIYAGFGLVEPVTHWFDYLYFSIVTFTSLGYGDLHPAGLAGKVTACAEIITGLIMFGLLLSFIGNRIQRT